MTVSRVGKGRRRVAHCRQVEGLGISGEDDPGHELHSGQTDVVQEAGGPEAAPPQARPPWALLASSHLAEPLRERGPRSGRTAVERGPSQTAPESRGASPRILGDSW